METFTFFWNQVRTVLNYPLVNLGKLPITLWLILYLIILFTLLFYASGKMKQWLSDRLLARRVVDVGLRHAIGSILRYVTLFLGFIIILQSAGIDLSALTILTGAVGIGIGLGLQNITNNFISGLIILFERPIKIGDRIEIGDIKGDVMRISARATIVMTNDNIAVIVPNSDFVSSKVINWSFPNPNVRFGFPVGVSYDSDPDQVRELLLKVAASHPGVLKEPISDVLFQEFGESELKFILRVWTREFTHKPNVLRSELNYGIIKVFKEHGIEMPFPQREVHIVKDTGEGLSRD
jgi:small-conductance mechanosensitive channel